MPAILLYTQKKCLDNAVVNGQNWEIKKEKEGYYKIALEK